jgi:hypothetical protein
MGNRLKLLIDFARLGKIELRLAYLHVRAIQTPTLTAYGDYNWVGWQAIKDELLQLVGVSAEKEDLRKPGVLPLCQVVLLGDFMMADQFVCDK